MPGRGQRKRAQALEITCAIHIDGEQKPREGEDAGLADWTPGAGVFACLDGCGGAGARRYAEADDWTGARLAAHLAGNAVADWAVRHQICECGVGSAPAETIAADLHEAVADALDGAHKRLHAGTAMRGSLTKSLPTTLSAVVVDTLQSPARNLFLWAGDSRGYLFTPAEGLMQMTADDVQGDMDAQDNLLHDGVLTNVASASVPFTLRVQEAYLNKPYLALVATDGCFSYFHSPLEFESVLLSTLVASDCPDRWAALLGEALGAVASDDYTLRLAAVGFATFSELLDAFRAREAAFQRDYRAPMRRMLQQNDAEGLRRLWQSYKKSYDKGPKT